MKKTNYLVIVACVLCVFFSPILKGQSAVHAVPASKASSVSANEKWHPIKINDAGNVLNGVSFFSKESNCNGAKVVLIRLVNANVYTVTVSYMENGVKKSIELTSALLMEGTCEDFSTANENSPTKLLTYVKPTTDAEKEAKRKILSTIEVVEKK